MLSKDSGLPIQAMPLGKGLGATSPYTVQAYDKAVEFVEPGTATIAFDDGTSVTVDMNGGSRYAIPSYVKTITFDGAFNIG